eukprot:TRINITY_DN28367_c0_g1_i2.p1 TRINITY_DN28367_c0_g1~~TRINITY_DN28367_c0_g1_i2.p1  ORF type:complete len:301 (-),score=45.06 TRINITY_DN28367_c0_g1_i2:35-937(-)
MEAVGSSRRVFEYYELMPSQSVVPNSQVEGRQIADADLRGSVQFRNVSFAYPGRPEDPVLQDFSLDVKAGSTVALVGTSGSGKSTIAALLQRWYDPLSGTVLIDQVPIQELDPRWVRSLLGVVTQDPHLFTATVRDNIALGLVGGPEKWRNCTSHCLEADAELDVRVREAAEAADADAFIRNLPMGYDTLIGDARLSGGQRQRIALARALVRRPRILILDEATSALDRQTEASVQAAIAEYQRRTSATCVLIAHRLSTVVDADKIVVLSEGRVAEEGSHSSLLRRGGAYAKLVKGDASLS